MDICWLPIKDKQDIVLANKIKESVMKHLKMVPLYKNNTLSLAGYPDQPTRLTLHNYRFNQIQEDLFSRELPIDGIPEFLDQFIALKLHWVDNLKGIENKLDEDASDDSEYDGPAILIDPLSKIFGLRDVFSFLSQLQDSEYDALDDQINAAKDIIEKQTRLELSQTNSNVTDADVRNSMIKQLEAQAVKLWPGFQSGNLEKLSKANIATLYNMIRVSVIGTGVPSPEPSYFVNPLTYYKTGSKKVYEQLSTVYKENVQRINTLASSLVKRGLVVISIVAMVGVIALILYLRQNRSNGVVVNIMRQDEKNEKDGIIFDTFDQMVDSFTKPVDIADRNQFTYVQPIDTIK